MHSPIFISLLFGLISLAGPACAYWRMPCSIIQTGRIDPIVSPGKVASHVHKIAGANIGLNSTYSDLRAQSCTSCEVTADKSAYWTPMLYYQHANGSFEDVPNSGMVVYYLGRGDNRANIQPFPPGFKMVSGDTYARSYNNVSLTYLNGRPIADRVSYACLDYQNPHPETPNLANTNCPDGLRAQIQFQSCWDGVNLYKSDQSHVAYMSQIDNGVCPPEYPVQLVHLFFEVLYSTASINQDGGRFTFSNGDPTGYGLHADFLNGWSPTVLQSALSQCANVDNGGETSLCPAFSGVDNTESGYNCPEQPSVVNERTTGMLSKLPGCNNVTFGPGEASPVVCPANTTQPSVSNITVPTGAVTTFVPTIGQAVNGWIYRGCGSELASGRAMTGATYTDSSNMTNSACQHFCAAKGFQLAGTEFGTQCFCDSTLSLATLFSLNQSCSSASMICAGNSSEICGGPSRLSIWNNTAYQPIFPSTIGVSLGQSTYNYIGCANETTGRALRGASFTNSTGMTIEACASFCTSKKFILFGVEYSQECYCDNSLAPGSALNQSGCSMLCTGNSSEYCGGSNRLTLFNSTLTALQKVGSSATTSYGTVLSLSSSVAGTSSKPSSSFTTHTTASTFVTSAIGTGSKSTITSSSPTLSTTAKLPASATTTPIKLTTGPSTSNTLFSTSTSSLKSSSTSTSSIKPSSTTSSSLKPASTTTTSLKPTSTTPLLPGATLGTNTFVGCANEPSSGTRALSATSYTNATGMTVSSCASFCSLNNNNNYPLFGLEYSTQCFCGYTLTAGSTLNQSGCTMTCSGNSSQTCGGPSRLSVWNNTLYKPAEIVPSVGNYLSLGCYAEGTNGRALTGASFTDAANLTVESCVSYCSGKGYRFAGSEYAQECYCGSAIANGGALTASTGCNMLCKGSKLEYCGGAGTLNVYLAS